VEQSQYAVPGTTDDLGIISSRKRARKLSTTSTTARLNAKPDDGPHEGGINSFAEQRGRKASGARVDFSSGGGTLGRTSNQGALSFAPSRSPLTARPQRPRTISKTSSTSSRVAASASNILGSASAVTTASVLLPDHSQTGLEKVISSRLTETFITIAIPLSTHYTGKSAMTSCTETSKRATVPTANLASPPRGRAGAGFSTNSFGGITGISQLDPQRSHKKKAEQSRLSGTATSTSSPSRQRFHSHANLAKPSSPTPKYLSPLHRPSTNPLFHFDARFDLDFLSWTDTGGQVLKLEIWGKIPTHRPQDIPTNERRPSGSNSLDDETYEWKMLDDWDVDLQDLIPLSDEVRSLCMHTLGSKNQ
jgi:hypothetical protein